MRKLYFAFLFLLFAIPSVHATWTWNDLATSSFDFHRIGKDAANNVTIGNLLNFNASTGIGATRLYVSGIDGSPRPLIAQVQTNSGSQPSGVLADSCLNMSIPLAQVTIGVLNEIDFPCQVNLTAASYWLVFKTDGNDGAAAEYHGDYDSPAGPASGMASFSTNNVWTAGTLGSNYRASYGFNYSVGSNIIDVYTPLNTTYYNVTQVSRSFSLNSSTNSSSMLTYQFLNGRISSLGFITNGSVNTGAMSSLINGQNNLTLVAFDGTQNTTKTVYFTVTNGLNLTVYNASQGTSTYLNGITFNISNSTNSSSFTGQTTPVILDTRTIPNSNSNQSVSIQVSKSGYVTDTFTASSGNNSLFSYAFGLWRTQEFKATSSNGTTITTFSLAVSSGSNLTSYSTTNGSVYVSLGAIPFGTFIATYSGGSLNTTNVTFSANSTSEINYTATLQQAGIIIFAYDEASCASTCQRIYFSYTATNGTSSTSNTSSLYFVNASYTDFPQGTVTFTFNNTVNGTYTPRSYFLSINSATAETLNVYLLNQATPTPAVYCVQTFAGVAIPDAEITIQRLFGSSYVTVAQGSGGSTGCYTFYLDFSIAYQVIVSATGYNTFTGIAQPVSNQIIKLSTGSAQVGFQTAYSDTLDIVQTILQPASSSLSGDWALINFTLYSYNATLTNWGLNCNYNGTIIYNANVTTSPSGGSTTTNITLTNKTGSFYCFGLFDRSGYNTSYVNQTYYINFYNTTFNNVSIYNIINQTTSQSWSPQAKAAIAILSTLGIVIWSVAAIGGAAAGLITIFSMAIFAFIGFIPMSWFILAILVGLGWTWFVSKQF